MSHIDDARIEAYLDGAYEALTAEELAEIERRIEDDAAFAARVAEARAVRDRAADILSLASPGDVELPSFEELQRQAATGSGEDDAPRRWLGLPPHVGLSWAATVVLALGVGWFVGQGAGTPGAGVRTPGSVAADRAAPAPEAEELTATADQTLVSEAQARDDGASEEPPAIPPEAPVDELREDAEGDRQALPATEDVPLAPTTVTGEAVLRDRAADADQKAAPERLEAREELDAFRRNAGEPASAGARPMEAPTFRLSGDHALHSLALPALEVIGVNLDDAGTLAGLEILHRLPTGDTLSLRYVGLFSQAGDPLRLGADERAEEEAFPSVSAQIQGAALPAGWRQVVVRKENRWLIARAPISEAEIRAYLMTLN